MKELLINSEFFTNKDAAKGLKELLAVIVKTAIKTRIKEEVNRCYRMGAGYSHWLQEVLTGRIETAICRPHDDRLLKTGINEEEELRRRINEMLYNEIGKYNGSPMVLHFEILERSVLFQRRKHEKNSDHVMMTFYETSPENPDKNLLLLSTNIFEKLGMTFDVIS